MIQHTVIAVKQSKILSPKKGRGQGGVGESISLSCCEASNVKLIDNGFLSSFTGFRGDNYLMWASFHIYSLARGRVRRVI